jgi:hypothetical protein
VAVCEDPVVTAKARSLSLLRARESQVIEQHRAKAVDYHGKRRPRLSGHLECVAEAKPGNSRFRILQDAWGTAGWLGRIYERAIQKPVRQFKDSGEGPPPWFVE